MLSLTEVKCKKHMTFTKRQKWAVPESGISPLSHKLLSYLVKILNGFLWMFGEHLVQISSHYEMVELESVGKFVELTRRDQQGVDVCLIADCLFVVDISRPVGSH